MKNKLILVSSALLMIVFGSMFIRSRNVFNAPSEPNPSPTPIQEIAEGSIVVTIDYEKGKVLSKNYRLSEDDTAFSVLEKITLENQISLKTKSYDFGVFVESIDELESGDEMAWIYFVNGESGQVAADQYELSPEDVVEWKYITPSENYQ